MRVLLTLALGALLVGGPAEAQIRLDRPAGGGAAPAEPRAAAGVIEDVTGEDVVRIMQGLEFSSVKLETNKNGSSYVKAAIDDTDTFIFLENCKEKRCAAILFAAYLGQQDSVDEHFIYDYNRNTIFTKLTKDKDGELMLMMGAGLHKGVTEEHLRSQGNLWINVFKQALEYKPSGK